MNKISRAIPVALAVLVLVWESFVRIYAQAWTPTSAPVTNWSCVASSANGRKLAAGVSGPYGNAPSGGIYVSTNSGITWQATSAPDTNWASIASSADGTKLVAVSFDFPQDPLHISTNSGSTWDTIVVPSNFWGCRASVGCSADAEIILAGSSCLAGEAYGSVIFISTNAGATWSSRDVTAYPVSVACSANGETMLTGFDAPLGWFLFFSTNSGITWRTGPAGYWYAVACSGDGTTMLASNGRGGAGPSPIYLSPNRGSTWTSVADFGVQCNSFAVSSDGMRMIAAASQGFIFSSSDSGVTWRSNTAPVTNWSCVASSADGYKLVAAVSGGGIYTSQTNPTPKLSIVRSVNNVVLSWTVPSTDFMLQQSSELNSTKWTPVSITPTLNYSNLQYQVTIPTPSGTLFYRLVSE